MQSAPLQVVDMRAGAVVLPRGCQGGQQLQRLGAYAYSLVGSTFRCRVECGDVMGGGHSCLGDGSACEGQTPARKTGGRCH